MTHNSILSELAFHTLTHHIRERGGLVDNASDSGVRAPLGSNHGVSLSKVHNLKVLVPRKRWLRPNMTEKLFTGTLRINQHHATYKFGILGHRGNLVSPSFKAVNQKAGFIDILQGINCAIICI